MCTLQRMPCRITLNSIYLFRAVVTNGIEKNDYHAIVSRAKRLDRDTCEKEGIVFGEGDQPPTSNMSNPSTGTAIPLPDKHLPHRVRVEPPPLDDTEAEHVARSLLDDMIDTVLQVDDTCHARLNKSNNATHSDTEDCDNGPVEGRSDQVHRVLQRHDSALSSVTSTTGSTLSKDNAVTDQQVAETSFM